MGYEFIGQMNNEDVLLVSKKHPFSIFKPVFKGLGIFLIPQVLNVFFNFGSWDFYLIIICTLTSIYLVYKAWSVWVNSTILLTNKRVLLVKQKGLFDREISGSGLSYIHRVNHEIKGIIPTIFNYGTLNVYTNDAQTSISITALGNPFEIQQAILEAVSLTKDREI